VEVLMDELEKIISDYILYNAIIRLQIYINEY
jgi:hypothetical protein